MKKLTLYFFIFFIFLFSGNTNAINTFEYPEDKVDQELCYNFLEEVKFPTFPYELKKPFTVSVELKVEDISKIDGKNLDFESFFTLWMDWTDPRVVEVLKKLQVYEDTDNPKWLCDFAPEVFWGKKRTLFDPTIEFFNRKSKPDLRTQAIDWVDIFSNGIIETRLRDTAKFKASTFDFRKFPFDSQTLAFELWSEFPSSIVSLEPYEAAMSEHKKNLFNFQEDEGIVIPGWNLNEVNYYPYKFEEPDDYSYQGFILELEVERISNYYILKIFLPIIVILMISWSVFWIHPREIEAKVNITMVALLTLIAYNLIMDEEIPKLSYVTFMDAFISITYFFTAAATVLCVYSYYRYVKYRRKVNLVDYYSRFIGPILYVISMLSCVNIFF